LGLTPMQIDAQQKPGSSPVSRRGWEHGPTQAKIGSQARIDVPEGYMFISGADTKTFLELPENFPSGKEVGMVADEPLSWFAIFTFDEALSKRNVWRSSRIMKRAGST
jgi:uncharacterized membrane-anchored protein